MEESTTVVKNIGKKELSFHHLTLPPFQVREYARRWLEEDVPNFDIAGCIVGEEKCEAKLLWKSVGVLAGVPFFDAVFRELDCEVHWFFDEGTRIQPIETVALVQGPTRNLLLGERVALNCLARASGVATSARLLCDLARKSGWKGKIAGTRKTTPGFRLVEKFALQVGGADTHRYDLSSMIMLKDNHLWSFGNITKAVNEARRIGGSYLKIEVECRSLSEALEAAQAGCDIVMLDNCTPMNAQVMASQVKSKFPSVLIEVSGGIHEENINQYFCEEIDLLSSGKLTQGYPTVDVSLKLINVK